MSEAPSDEEKVPGGAPKLGRRQFVVGAGVGAASVAGALAGYAAGASDHQPAPRAHRLGMVIDLDRCVGCQACSVACKSEHGVRLGGFRAWVSEREMSTYPKVRRAFLPRLCNREGRWKRISWSEALDLLVDGGAIAGRSVKGLGTLRAEGRPERFMFH